MASEGGFGGLGIGNPGSYGGQQSVGAPGFGGSGTGGGLSDILSSLKSGFKVGMPLGAIFGQPIAGGAIGALGNAVYDGIQNFQGSEFGTFSNPGNGTDPGAGGGMEGMGAVGNNWVVRPDGSIDYKGGGGNFRGMSTADVQRMYAGNPGMHDLGDVLNAVAYLEQNPGSTITSEGYAADPTDPTGTGQTTDPTGTGQADPTGTTGSYTDSPLWGMYKNAAEQQYAGARDNIMSSMPQGGGLLEMLASADLDKARTLTQGAGSIGQDEITRAHQKDLAEMGANVTLQGQATQSNIAANQLSAYEDAQQQNLLAQLGMALAFGDLGDGWF